MNEYTDLASWLNHLECLHLSGKTIVMGLDRIRIVKDVLNQIKRCPIIIVGGTNGKGSTCAFLENIFEQAGYKVGCYTSPHLEKYNERIRINGKSTTDIEICSAFEVVEAARKSAGNIELTFFEFSTLGAWEVFSNASVDVIILEVGMGGRLDAVNVYEPDVSIITSIDIDHIDFLGSDREAISKEKSAIFRPGCPAICSDQNPPKALINHAKTIGAELMIIGQDFGFNLIDGQFNNKANTWEWWRRHNNETLTNKLCHPSMPGKHQLLNISAALAAIHHLNSILPVSSKNIRAGIINTYVPGRFQTLLSAPRFVVDIAHNPQAVKVLSDNLSEMDDYNEKHAIIGMLSDKDISGSIKLLAGKFDFWHAVTLNGVRGSNAADIAKIIETEGGGGHVICYDSADKAVNAVLKNAKSDDLIIAFGSFYTVAGVMAALTARQVK